MAEPTTHIEAWFTGSSADALAQVADELAEHGAVVTTAAWNTFGDAPEAPANPWSLVLSVPAALDPTLVAATADRHGCRYLPGDGSSRWERSSAARTVPRGRGWRRKA
jgi:hypothetical protein